MDCHIASWEPHLDWRPHELPVPSDTGHVGLAHRGASDLAGQLAVLWMDDVWTDRLWIDG